MYIPKHFKLYELVSKVDYESLGTRCWQLLDERMLITLDTLREIAGAPITVNNWYYGGSLNWRGLRTAAYYGSLQKYADSRSMHKYGKAFDADIKGLTAEQARQLVYAHKDALPFVSFVEDNVNWLHCDTRNGDRITVWCPNTGNTRII